MATGLAGVSLLASHYPLPVWLLVAIDVAAICPSACSFFLSFLFGGTLLSMGAGLLIITLVLRLTGIGV